MSDAHAISTVVLVDQDVAGDRRVENILADAAGNVMLLDLREADDLPLMQRGRDLVKAALLMLLALGDARRRHRELALHLRPPHSPFVGLLACLRWTTRAVGTARALERQLSSQPGKTVVHANDLAAGFTVHLARRPACLHVIYDSHELQIHRHRRAGWLRVLIEHAQERAAIALADETRTVNMAVAHAMQALHPRAALRPRVVLNDLYPHRDLPLADNRLTPGIVYVGRATEGRSLERLCHSAEELGFDVFGWLLGSPACGRPPPRNWRHATSSDYEMELIRVARERRCVMWCCLDPRSLSYRLATPNKLFQALALGLPSIVTPGTYLAQVVEEFGIGVVDTGDLRNIAQRVQSDEYAQWVDNVRAFRSQLRAGRLTI